MSVVAGKFLPAMSAIPFIQHYHYNIITALGSTQGQSILIASFEAKSTLSEMRMRAE